MSLQITIWNIFIVLNFLLAYTHASIYDKAFYNHILYVYIYV